VHLSNCVPKWASPIIISRCCASSRLPAAAKPQGGDAARTTPQPHRSHNTLPISRPCSLVLASAFCLLPSDTRLALRLTFSSLVSPSQDTPSSRPRPLLSTPCPSLVSPTNHHLHAVRLAPRLTLRPQNSTAALPLHPVAHYELYSSLLAVPSCHLQTNALLQ
jgi:hypothetical protein